MKHFLFIAVLILTVPNLNGQTNYKETDAIAFNLVAGYQGFPSQADIDTKLTSNNFTKLNNSPFTLGVEFAVTGKHSVLKSQFRGTNVFTSKKVQEMTNQSASISFQYGYDLLSKSPRTYLYPFAAIRYYNWTIFGKSTDGKKLSADRNLFDALMGIGLRQFLNNDLHGVFNNLDISFGLSLPLTNGKWNAFDDTDASFIAGTMKNKPTFFVLVTIGRGFRPAKVR
jgi:hypothetical protein